jgi:hypothetical protein
MSGAGGEDRAAEAARRRREFIRDHHPDRGGDADSFIAGLRGFDAGRAPGDPRSSAGSRSPGDPGGAAAERAAEPPPRVVVVPHRAWLTRLAAAAVRRLRHGRKPARVR